MIVYAAKKKNEGCGQDIFATKARARREGQIYLFDYASPIGSGVDHVRVK